MKGGSRDAHKRKICEKYLKMTSAQAKA